MNRTVSEYYKDIEKEKSAHSSVFATPSFWIRASWHILQDVKYLMQECKLIFFYLVSFVIFLFDFPVIKQNVTTYIFFPAILFIVINYLTIIPIIFFFGFLFVPKAVLWPLMAVASFFSLLYVVNI